MRKSFSLNTVPHEAEIGDTVLLFVPEAAGDAFIERYANLRDIQKKSNVDGEDFDPAQVREVTEALRDFIADFMLPESREAFSVMQLPTRVLVQLMEWVAELYGGGAGGTDGNGRPTGRSGGSPASRRTPGTPSKAN